MVRFLRPSVWLVLALCLAASGFRPAGQNKAGAVRTFICPMHPDVIGVEGDTCPRCGMRLVPSDPVDTRAPSLDLQISPRAITPGEPGVLRFRLFRPGTGTLIKEFEPLHERAMHVFLVAHDLDYFAHVHPDLAADGTLELPVSLPHAGVYHAFVEFMPRGGVPQLMQRAFATAGWRGPVARNQMPTDVTPKVDRGLEMQIQLPADGLVAGRASDFRCSITDAASGAPVRDLQPYLGTLAHLFIVSTDLDEAAHEHPIPDFSDPAGPNLVFEATFPRAGQYRLWLQVQRAGTLFVTSFTVPVGPG